jgi:hypothetical protein
MQTFGVPALFCPHAVVEPAGEHTSLHQLPRHVPWVQLASVVHGSPIPPPDAEQIEPEPPLKIGSQNVFG